MSQKVFTVGRKEFTVEETIADKVVEYFSPERYARRMRSRLQVEMASGGYSGGQSSKRTLTSWITKGNDADGDINPDLVKLRERSRDLGRNSPLAAGAFSTKVDHVVGTGLALRPRIDHLKLGWTEAQADALGVEIQREWRLWAESPECDATRTLNFYELQALAFRAVLESGDVLAVLPHIERVGNPYGLKVQLVEADRLSNPKSAADTDAIAGGVEVDGHGAPVAYHIARTHPGNLRTARPLEWDRLEAYGRTGRKNVIHLYRKMRPGQRRGVPDLAPVIESLKQLDRYTEAEIMAAVVSGMFTVFVKTQNGAGLSPMSPTTEVGGATSDEDFRMANGAILDLLPGEDVTFANPNRPNTAYDPFTIAILRQIGVGLDLPFEVLMKHFTASYSASKAALLIAWKFFNGRRAWLAGGFCDPVYEAWLTEAVARGRIRAPGFLTGDASVRKAYLGCVWVGDAPGHLDETKEVEAARMRVELGVSTLDREAMLITGEEFEEVTRQRGKEVAARKAAGLVEVPKPGAAAPFQNNDESET